MAMINLSYNLSTNLKNSLQKIEDLHARILLTPLSQDIELKLRWEAMIKRVYYSLVLNENTLSKLEIVKLFTILSQKKKRFSRKEQEALKYKKGLDYISHEWLVSSKSVTPKVTIYLQSISCKGRLRATETSLKQIFDYLQASSEHPVIQAAIAQISLLTLDGFTQGNDSISRLVSYLFLYKFGYDFRGLLYLEEYFNKDITSYKENIENASRSNNLTIWLEYFAQGVATQLDKALTDILTEKYSTDIQKNFSELNDRQKEILFMLDQPNLAVSNKKVQKMFKVSQITASRDLAKLVTLDLLFTHGKGRSVYYTKV